MHLSNLFLFNSAFSARLLGSEDAETENIAPTDFVC